MNIDRDNKKTMQSLRRDRVLWDTLAIFVLAILPFVDYWQVALGQKVFFADDIYRFFYPVRLELTRAFTDGRLPLWVTGMSAGFPLFAEGQVAALYPLNLLLHRFVSAPMAVSYTVLIQLTWAGVGMYIFCRTTGLGSASAFLAGLVFSASGFMLAHLQHLTLLAVAVWLPWLMLCQQEFWRARWMGKRAAIWFVLASFCIGLQLLGGFPQMAWLSLSVFALFGILAPLVWQSSPLTRRHFLEAGLVTCASILLGAGLAAVQLLPSAELLGWSVRGQEVGKDFFTSFSLAPLAVTQLVAPFWGLGEPFWGNIEFWAYIGVVPMLLALLALWLRRDARTRLFALLGLLALAFALGDANPLYQLLSYVPVFNRFRVPARFLFLFTFASAFLAATGLEGMVKRLPAPPRIDWRHRAYTAIIAVGIGVLLAGAFQFPPAFWIQTNWQPFALVACGLGTFSAVKLKWPTGVRFAEIALGLTILDLAVFSIPFSTLNQQVAPDELTSTTRSVALMDPATNSYRVLTSDRIPTNDAGARAMLRPNLQLVFDRQGVKVYTPLELARNAEYIRQMSPQMLNLMNVRYYLQPVDIMFLPDSSSTDSPVLNLFQQKWAVSLQRIVRVEIVSYTDKTVNLPNGFAAGELTLFSKDADRIVLPMRLGTETADWTVAAVAAAKHSKPAASLTFPAYLSSLGHTFDGIKSVARFDLNAPHDLTGFAAESFLPEGDFVVESVIFVDDAGRSFSLAALTQQNDFVLVFRSHLVEMWENSHALPRALLVHRAEVVEDAQVLAKMREPDFRPDQLLLLAEGHRLSIAGETGNAPLDEAAIIEYKPERVSIKAKTDRPAYLLLTDTWYPGWEAAVDGQRVPIYRADYIFRAVLLQPGDHTVVFEYHPTSFCLGAAISGFSLMLCGVWIVWDMRPRRMR